MTGPEDPGPAPRSQSPGQTRVSVLVSNRQNLSVDEAGLAERTLEAEGVRSGELSLSFVGLTEMEELHRRFAGEPGPTDVLSFPIGEDGLLGDVVVCPEEANRNEPDIASELRLLVVHGVLHLLGYDHQRDPDRRVMWDKQAAYSGVRLS